MPVPDFTPTMPEMIRTRSERFGIRWKDPDTVTGRIGTWASIARWNPPLLNSRMRPVGLRVPSGKTITLTPPRTRSAARLKLWTDFARSPRSITI